jgi:hypothetical protein
LQRVIIRFDGGREYRVDLLDIGLEGQVIELPAPELTTRVTIIVEHEEDRDGKPRPRVKWINGGGGLAVKQKLEGAAAKAFAQRMRGYALASRQRSGAPQQQRPQNGTRRPPDEPLPFDDDIGF